jgi:hypothetical protein
LLRSGIPALENYPDQYRQKLMQRKPGQQVSLPKSDSLNWADLKELRKRWSGSLMVKGVLHPDDAQRALECGADAIVVSNHGGRNLDIAIAPIDALPAIVERVNGRADGLLDSGIRRGSDIFKALALGAKGVFAGRAPLWGVTAAGEEGAFRALAKFPRARCGVRRRGVRCAPHTLWRARERVSRGQSVCVRAPLLMSLVEPSADVCKPLDRLSLRVARSSLRLKANCPNSLAWAESRLLPCEAILARERSRFLLQLQLSPLPSLAQRIYNALAWRYDPALHPKQWATTTLWTHRMLFLQGRYGKAGGPAAVVTHVGLAPARDEVVWFLPPPFVAAAWNPTALWYFVQLQPPPARVLRRRPQHHAGVSAHHHGRRGLWLLAASPHASRLPATVD